MTTTQNTQGLTFSAVRIAHGNIFSGSVTNADGEVIYWTDAYPFREAALSAAMTWAEYGFERF